MRSESLAAESAASASLVFAAGSSFDDAAKGDRVATEMKKEAHALGKRCT